MSENGECINKIKGLSGVRQRRMQLIYGKAPERQVTTAPINKLRVVVRRV